MRIGSAAYRAVTEESHRFAVSCHVRVARRSHQDRVIGRRREIVSGNVTRPLISIIVPVFNSADNLRPFHDAVTDVIVDTGVRLGFLFVDDGSATLVFEVLGGLRASRRARALRSRAISAARRDRAGIDYCTATPPRHARIAGIRRLDTEFVDRWRSGTTSCGARTGPDEGALRSYGDVDVLSPRPAFAIPTIRQGGRGLQPICVRVDAFVMPGRNR